MAFLHVAQEVLVPTQEELSALRTLEESISARKIVFHTTIGEYNHWNDISKTHPDYRDVLYRLGQKSYMLFDDAHARVLVQEAVNMDPQFLQGEKVLNLLGQ